MTEALGLYIHVPFCKRKCNYCDFFSVCDFGYAERYVQVLVREIKSYKREPRLELSSVFFGGGTPTLLSGKQIEAIMLSVRESFNVSPNAEITTEANPGTVDREKLSHLYSLGFNRISFGLQSIHENELKILGRIHTFDEFLTSYNMARSVGFSNINVDLMYGIPCQTAESLRQTLERVIALSPEHISAYGLIIEPGTPFFERKDELHLPSEDEERAMYDECVMTLDGAGYSHYEISNYAKPGFECRHNLVYWRNGEYIGVGADATSYFQRIRFSNTRSFSEYFSNECEKYRRSEPSNDADVRYEYAMMRLRLKEGMSLSEYKKLFGLDFLSGKEELINKLLENGYISLRNGSISLTDSGMYVSNSILVELL